MLTGRKHPKPELLEESFVLAHLDCSLCLTLASQLTLHFRAESLKTTSFVKGDVHRAPCGHEVIGVTDFHRRLGLWLLGGEVRSDCHSARTAVNSSHQSMAIGLVWGATIMKITLYPEWQSTRTIITFLGFMSLPILTATSRYTTDFLFWCPLWPKRPS